MISDEKIYLIEPIFSEEEIENLKSIQNNERFITNNNYKYKVNVYYKNKKMHVYSKSKKMSNGKIKNYAYYYARENGEKILNIPESKIDKEVLKHQVIAKRKNIEERLKTLNHADKLLKQGKITKEKYAYIAKINSKNKNSTMKIIVKSKDLIVIEENQ